MHCMRHGSLQLLCSLCSMLGLSWSGLTQTSACQLLSLLLHAGVTKLDRDQLTEEMMLAKLAAIIVLVLGRGCLSDADFDKLFPQVLDATQQAGLPPRLASPAAQRRNARVMQERRKPAAEAT